MTIYFFIQYVHFKTYLYIFVLSAQTKFRGRGERDFEPLCIHFILGPHADEKRTCFTISRQSHLHFKV